jgi:transcriptional regulator with XRE-family HTH domain
VAIIWFVRKMEDIFMKINEKIKSLRLKSGMTQEQLANRIGVSAQSISKWENGISMPDISLLPFIAEVFGVSIDDLFDLTVDEKLKRIENRIEIESEFSPDVFKEYEVF